jgi:hypothetical protein
MSNMYNGVQLQITQLRAGLMSLSNLAASIKEQMDKLDCITTIQYWDCECETDYIHPRSQDNCEKCKATREDSPDSRVLEVYEAKLEL